MKREFTQREEILLLILVVILLLSGYVKLFMEPLENQLSAAQNQLATAQDSLTMEQTKLAQLQKMEKELGDGNSSGTGQTAEIPDYDNIDNVMIQLDAMLTAASTYQMTFADLKFGDELVSRPIQMSFTAGDYAAARTILTALYNCKYCCALSDLTVTAAAQDGAAAGNDVTAARGVSVELTATFYERYDKAAAGARAAAGDAGSSADSSAGSSGGT